VALIGQQLHDKAYPVFPQQRLNRAHHPGLSADLDCDRRPQPTMPPDHATITARAWLGRPAATVFYSWFSPRVLVALTPVFCRACWSLLHP
jgi:hypothetical protein